MHVAALSHRLERGGACDHIETIPAEQVRAHNDVGHPSPVQRDERVSFHVLSRASPVSLRDKCAGLVASGQVCTIASRTNAAKATSRGAAV